jgi:hypothetical protein
MIFGFKATLIAEGLARVRTTPENKELLPKNVGTGKISTR